MELIKKQIHCNKVGKRSLDQFFVDEDYNVPDAKEDVLRIIQGEGFVKIEDLKLVENYIRVSGKLFFHVLYATAQGEPKLSVLESKIPFEEMIYVEGGEEENYFVRSSRVEFHASLVHSRKISIRAMIELELSQEELSDEETTVDMESSAPIFKKKKSVNLLQMHTTKKDTYRIKEEITLPGTKESVGQILMSKIANRKLEIRIGQDELLLRGELLVFCLYISEEGKTDWMEQSVSYDGRIDCYGVDDGMYHHVHTMLEDQMLDVRMDEDGEMRILGIEGTLSLRINIYEEEEIELLEDVYSLEQNCRLETREASYEELLIQNHSKCKVSETLSLPELKEDVLQICHSDGTVQMDRMEVTPDGIQLEGILHVSFLYIKADDEMPFDTWQGMVPFSYLLEGQNMSEDVRYHISNHLEQLSVNLAGSEAVEIKAVLAFDTFIRKPVQMEVITDVKFEPLSMEELEKRPGIIGYIVKDNDDLWDLAKRYLTTVEGIMEVNELGSETIKPGDRLLIFKENVSIL